MNILNETIKTTSELLTNLSNTKADTNHYVDFACSKFNSILDNFKELNQMAAKKENQLDLSQCQEQKQSKKETINKDGYNCENTKKDINIKQNKKNSGNDIDCSEKTLKNTETKNNVNNKVENEKTENKKVQNYNEENLTNIIENASKLKDTNIEIIACEYSQILNEENNMDENQTIAEAETQEIVQEDSTTNALYQAMSDVFTINNLLQNDENVYVNQAQEQEIVEIKQNNDNSILLANETSNNDEVASTTTTIQTKINFTTDNTNTDTETNLDIETNTEQTNLNITNNKETQTINIDQLQKNPELKALGTDVNIKTEKNISNNDNNKEFSLLEKANKLTEKMIENAEVKISQDIINTSKAQTQVQEKLSETLLKAQMTQDEENQVIETTKDYQHSEKDNTKLADSKNAIMQNTNIKISGKENISETTDLNEEIENNNVAETAEENINTETTNNNNINVEEQKNEINTFNDIKVKSSTLVQTKLTTNIKTNILNQVNSKFEQLKDGTTTKVNIILRPENLGKVGIELVSRPDGLTARILADTQQVKELLDKNIDMLKNSLQTQGVNVNNITIKAVESSQGSEFNTADNFDFLNNENQHRNETLGSKSDDDYENRRKYDSEDEFNQNYEDEQDTRPELKEVEKLYSQHNGKVDLVV